jgi:hypothetical protein
MSPSVSWRRDQAVGGRKSVSAADALHRLVADARVDARGSGFENSTIYLKSQLASSVQNGGVVSEDHLTVI